MFHSKANQFEQQQQQNILTTFSLILQIVCTTEVVLKYKPQYLLRFKTCKCLFADKVVNYVYFQNSL